MLVKADVRNRHPHLVQRGGPLQQLRAFGIRARQRLAKQPHGERRDACGMRAVDRVAVDEARHGDAAHVGVDGSAEEVVENSETQRASDGVDPVDSELGHGCGHDRESAGQHRRALGLERVQRKAPDVPRREHPLLEPGEA